ncbi:MAG TPA: DUF1376 domain-containing protein [Caulobacterales bacterium]|nr:DUF1376 domain-containing protein [Caulobacterales bacterium]
MAEFGGGDKLPAPLTPADCDLRSFTFMPLEIERLQKSKQWLIAKRRPEIGFYAMNLWARSWREVPAASLEDDDEILIDAAMCAPERWAEVRADVMRGWVKCSDGRLYHRIVADIANEALDSKREKSTRGKKGAKARWGANADDENEPPTGCASNADAQPTHADAMPTDGNRQDSDNDSDTESVVAGSAPERAAPNNPVSGVTWLQRLAGIQVRFGTILGPSASVEQLQKLCEPGTGPPCDWDRDVLPAIEQVLGGYLRRDVTVSSLAVARKQSIANRDARLASPSKSKELSHGTDRRNANEADPASKPHRRDRGSRRGGGGLVGVAVRNARRRAQRGEGGDAGDEASADVVER